MLCRKAWNVAGLVALCSMVGWVAQASAQEGMPAPTEEHELLKKSVGTWKAECKMWMQGPEGEPMVSQATETNRLLGDGMWLISEFKGEFGGMPFEGSSQIGYDPSKKKYVGTWIDSFNSHMSLMEGTYDESANEITMMTEGRDPATGAKTVSKNVTKYVDANTRVMTMYNKMPDSSGEFVRVMEITYKRTR